MIKLKEHICKLLGSMYLAGESRQDLIKPVER